MPEDLIKGWSETQASPQIDLLRKLAADGQNPKYFIISCMDSRSSPSTLMKIPLGSAFGHRPMGAIVRDPDTKNRPTEMLAKLKYAIEYSGIEHIIVMGHTHCGAINALVHGLEDEDIRPWLSVAKAAFDRAKGHGHEGEELLRETERQAVIESIKNLMKYPIVANAVREGRLHVHGWVLDMGHGEILDLDKISGKFSPINIDDYADHINDPHDSWDYDAWKAYENADLGLHRGV